MKIVVKPRSDQWNADDFIGGPRTFTIAGARKGAAEAPYDIELAEGEGRVWRPPNGMLSALLQLWGDEAAQWIGRRVTLFNDPTVKFGNETPGGIRISHMSDIGPKPVTVRITVSRGRKGPYTVHPISAAAPSAQPSNTVSDRVKADTAKAVEENTLDGYIAYLHEQGAPEHVIEYASTHKKDTTP